MQRVQLYVEDMDGNLQLVDLFQDESIQVTSTIQDLKDIGKVFTDYSQTFNVPASDTNNKIFRHFYNYYITNGAYDARKKKRAEIHINYMPFRRGKIFLNSVKMKLNKPHSYDITFYGETVSLKDLIGDDELTDLTYLDNYSHDYDNDTVKSGLTQGLDLNGQSDSVIYPLITSKKRLFYNSDSPSVGVGVLDSDGNLYRDASPSTTRGLEFTDLKPAIKTLHIIEAIEQQYGINFTRSINTGSTTRDTFFSSDYFSNLYMWMNSKKGEFNDLDDDEGYLFSKKLTGYTFAHIRQGLPTAPDQSGSAPTLIINFDGSTIQLNFLLLSQLWLNLSVSDQTIKYKVIFRNLSNGTEEIYDSIGDNIFTHNLVSGTANYEIEIQSQEPLTVSSAELAVLSTLAGVANWYVYDTSTNLETVAFIDVLTKLPKLKVIDFLTGIFKIFNLTAFYIDDIADSNFGKIYVDTVDNFYSDAAYNKIGPTIDIDKYLDTTEHTVNSTLPFTDIEFKYEETNTVLMENHFEQFNEVFGDAEFNVRRNFPDQIDRGTKYEIKVPFSHMKYERIIDTAISGTQTDIQWGYCAGGEFTADTDAPTPTGDYDTMTIKPLLFYGILESGITNTINWINNNSTTSGLTSYWKPSNARTNDISTGNSLNFDLEFDEWNSSYNYNSLYEVFYSNYVEGVFNVAKRIFKVTAYLPPNILVNYRLNDQIKIQDQMFRINSITTELTTGKSELELLNIFSEDIVE
jgi:hypothetical protein